MKKVFSFLAVATCAFFMTNCGGGGGGNTPASIQKSIYTQMQKGNYEKAVEIMIENLDSEKTLSTKDAEGVEMLKAFTEKAKESAEAKGGLKSFEITGEEVSEDGLSTTVSAKLVYGNGKEETETTKYVQKDGKWKLSMGK